MMKYLFLLAVLALSVSALSLTSENFDEHINGKSGFVKFFAPWCGHCKRMKPDWDALMDEYADTSVVVAEVDCTEEEELCARFGVSGYPTLKYFTPGNPDAEDYQMGRDLDALQDFVRENLEAGCQVEDLSNCNEKEVKFIEVMKGKTAEERAAQVVRLEGMRNKPMKAELKKWLKQRLAILAQL
eukprot:CAMPEP_0201520544 /NCGR_PEP_ID=MMETSP0161_2-20130828/11775_1 /ASSEMBLY_ACC=CAM_ASM_000251 /TAXON_ID=180227 /ORGANISM="Neoparamoeba aestuarina, Strain SoJaBio B1-5/56/2" /LENGTH=184 /DNA_ID=CAMNT_0047918953 /DNA_START=40 /DNA_END=594 /DNA_ORIENTATION=-